MNNISKKARQILSNLGITSLEILLGYPPRFLWEAKVSFRDLFALMTELEKQFGRERALAGRWSKDSIHQLMEENRKKRKKKEDTSVFPSGVDGRVIAGLIHRATGKHYKKPRRKRGLF